MTETKTEGGTGPKRPSPLLTIDSKLSLSLLSLSEAEEIFNVVEENRTYLRKTLPWLDEVNCLSEKISYISHCISDYETNKGIMYSIILNGKIIGTVGLNWIDHENKSCGVGYWVSEAVSYTHLTLPTTPYV